MNKTDNAAATICALDIKGRIDHSLPLEQRIREAFKCSQDFWMSTDDNVRFSGALVAVAACCTEEDKALIVRSKKRLDALSAMLDGVPVDFDKAMADPDEPVLPLLRWYQDAQS